MLRRPAARRAALPFVRLALPRLRRCLGVLAMTPRPLRPRRPPEGPGVCWAGFPFRPSTVETTGTPRFLEDPLYTCPGLRPRRDQTRQAICDAPGAAFRSRRSRRLPRREHLSRLNPTARILAVYASSAEIAPGLRKTRFRLLAGLYRTGWVSRWVLPQGLHAMSSTWHSSLPRLRLAHRRCCSRKHVGPGGPAIDGNAHSPPC